MMTPYETPEEAIDMYTGIAMDYYKMDNDPKMAMDFLKNAKMNCIKAQGEFSNFTFAERRKIRKELQNWWRAIAVNNAGICDMFRG